jgi:uncharacterized protein (TIGR02679 family)
LFERQSIPFMASPLDPALHRTLLVARDRRERRGASGDGQISVPDLGPEEALALDGLLSPRKPILPGRTLRIALSQFEEALRSCGIEPRAAYEQVGERPLRDLPAERRTRHETRERFGTWLRSHEVVRSQPILAEWFERALRQGRVRVDMQPLVEQALQILAVLPSKERIQRTVIAAQVFGDPHALDIDTPLHGLLVSILAAVAELDSASSAREIWSAWNVLVDTLSSNVAALNLPLLGETNIARHARAMHGQHVILTYGQLAAGDLRWPGGAACFSCENPSVLIAAEHALGESCPPLICTSGRPSDAVRSLFSTIQDAGAQICHHGDFDQAGVQILRDLEARYDAKPWRFDLESICDALCSLGRPPLDPRPAALEHAVRQLATPLAEELLIDGLIADLRTVGKPLR